VLKFHEKLIKTGFCWIHVVNNSDPTRRYD
jgi:hypothetical protein